MTEGSAKRALERARTEKPDVCILDIGLPEVDGNALAKAIRQQAELDEVILIAMTGYGQESDKQLAFDAGFDHYMANPVDTAALISLLAYVADQKAL